MTYTAAATNHIGQNINNISLISLGNLCDGGHEEKVRKNICKAHKDESPIITAPRCKNMGMHVMYMMNLKPKFKIKCDEAVINSSVVHLI